MAAYRRSGAFSRVLRLAVLGFALSGLAACGHLSGGMMRDRDCLARVMYFESIRSSDEGMLAVGTVVMNRVESNKYPNSVCGVVGQSNQFAPGTLSRSMSPGKSRDRAYRIADQVLRGKRHRGVGKAMFFHTAGRTYGYSNMHYVSVAGGNAFYERSPTPGRAYIPRSVIAQAGPLELGHRTALVPWKRISRRDGEARARGACTAAGPDLCCSSAAATGAAGLCRRANSARAADKHRGAHPRQQRDVRSLILKGQDETRSQL